MSAFAPAPKPKSNLGYHRILAPTAGVRVSPLCLGAMSFGDAWSDMMGSCDKQKTFEILDLFRENGGNFIDTANNYQDEQSETWIGEWMASRGCRDEMIIATKYTTLYPGSTHPPTALKTNYQGNSRKSLHLSVAASLRKLQTTYLDLLYLHWWDYTTSIPELMHSLHALVTAGKVLYLGVSDTPAWIVAKANQYARDHSLTPFSVYQGLWNAATRDFEREIIPMCESEGMALCPWGPLGQGRFKTEEQWKANDGRKMMPATEDDRRISKVLEKIAKRKGTILTNVALAYILHKVPYVFPIVGCRKPSYVTDAISALSLTLTPEEIDEIETAIPYDPGFPYTMIFGFAQPEGFRYRVGMGTSDIGLVRCAGYVDSVPPRGVIPPRTE